jgi:hypothetical protein
MKLAWRNTNQAWAGVVFIAVGLFAVVEGGQYSFGTLTHMGPGVFPISLGVLLMAIGIAAMLQSFARHDDDAVRRIDVVPIFFLMTGVVSFGLLVERAGLIAAIFVLILLSCYGRLRERPVEVLVIATCVSILSAGLFVYLLQLSFALY